MLWLYQRTAFGEPSPEFSGGAAHSLSAGANDDEAHVEIRDVTPIEWIAWTPFLVAILVFGVYPQLMFQIIDPAVTAMVSQLGQTLG